MVNDSQAYPGDSGDKIRNRAPPPGVATGFQPSWEARMWLTLFGIVLVMSVGFGLGSVLADLFERNEPV
jgi:hypothetical protein